MHFGVNCQDKVKNVHYYLWQIKRYRELSGLKKGDRTMTVKEWLITIPIAIISVLMIAGAWTQEIHALDRYTAMINNLINKIWTLIF